MVDLARITEHAAVQFIQDHLTWDSYKRDKRKLTNAHIWRALLFAFGAKSVDIVREAAGGDPQSVVPFPAGEHLSLGLRLTSTGPRFVSGTNTRDANILNVIGGLLRFGDEEQDKMARRLYEQVRRDLEKDEGWGRQARIGQSEFFQHNGTWWSPINPTDYGLEFMPVPEGKWMFHVSLLGWFDMRTASRILSRASEGFFNGLPLAALLNEYLGNRYDEAVRRGAENAVRNYSKSQPEYDKLARWLQFVGSDFFKSWSQRLKGVKQALGVVRADAPDAIFVKGIRTLTADKPRIELGPWVAKPLRFKMISRMSIDNFVTILHELPWRVVEPMVTKEKDKVVNKLVEVVERTDLIEKSRMLFTDHNGRLKPKDWTLDKARDEIPDEAFLWETQMEKRVRHHRIARDYRKAILKEPGMDRHRLFLIAHHMMNPDPKKLRAYVELLQEVDTEHSIEKAMRTFPEHLLPGFQF